MVGEFKRVLPKFYFAIMGAGTHCANRAKSSSQSIQPTNHLTALGSKVLLPCCFKGDGYGELLKSVLTALPLKARKLGLNYIYTFCSSKNKL